ncbi:MAG: Fur family transcriptional regulator [Gammaproteobacteria bacterium]|nr:Fur family transcriptional regulator [Gammaproteobacteria bacterium]
MTLAPSKFIHGSPQVAAYLRSHGITPTLQRIRIGEALFAKAQHVSAEQVLSMVNKENEEVSKATVYNTLGLFASKGLLHEVVIEASKVFYDTNLDKHHHLYHIDTGVLEDISANQVKIGQLPELPDGTILEDVDVIIRLRKS